MGKWGQITKPRRGDRKASPDGFNRPCGTCAMRNGSPGVETPGYSPMSLRDRSQSERRGGEEERGLRQRHGAIEAAKRLGRGLVHKVIQAARQREVRQRRPDVRVHQIAGGLDPVGAAGRARDGEDGGKVQGRNRGFCNSRTAPGARRSRRRRLRANEPSQLRRRVSVPPTLLRRERRAPARPSRASFRLGFKRLHIRTPAAHLTRPPRLL